MSICEFWGAIKGLRIGSSLEDLGAFGGRDCSCGCVMMGITGERLGEFDGRG